MRLLLDTHVLIWAVAEPRRLSAGAATAIRDPGNDVLVSAASTWEIAIKSRLGKVAVEAGVMVEALAAARFEELPVTIRHSLRVRDLPDLHGDPFDRLLIAQAVVEGLTLVTHDRLIRRYRVPVLWG